ncbi:MAG: hypothetical protein JST68_12965, partial [Bacteroidetes bacterium]|nr:hypothetical protein [Bacteroidota bacterium]
MKRSLLLLSVVLLCLGCRENQQPKSAANVTSQQKEKAVSCESNIPSRFAAATPQLPAPNLNLTAQNTTAAPPPSAAALAAHPGMTWVPGGTYRMGADNKEAQP